MSTLLSILGFVGDLLLEFAKGILILFPLSPFRDIENYLNDGVKEFFAYANYYIPFEDILAIGGVWLLAVGTYVGYGVILKLVKSGISLPKI